MLIGGDDNSNDTCFSIFVYICVRFRFALIGGNLTGQSKESRRGIGGGIQIPVTQLQALLPFPTPPPERAGELALTLRNPQREIQNPRQSGTHAAIAYHADQLYPGYYGLPMLCFEFRSSLHGDLCEALDVSARGVSLESWGLI